MTSLPQTGGCMCGALRYELRAPPTMIYNCHCTNCQKISGSAFNVAAAVAADAVVFTAGEPAVVEWLSEAANVRRGWFCAACGSRIVNGVSRTRGLLSLRCGTLDDTSWVQPVGDIWIRSRQPWVSLVPGGLRAERGAEDYAPFIETYAAQGRFNG